MELDHKAQMEQELSRIDRAVTSVRTTVQVAGSIVSVLVILAVSISIAAFTGLKNDVNAKTAQTDRKVEDNRKELTQNGKAIERYEAIAKEQSRRLDRIESDVREIKREIKEGQSTLIRKLDTIILERSFRDNHPVDR